MTTVNIMTVDVEDWFHILDVEAGYGRSDWASLESRVERNTQRLLELFEAASARATFFIVGWVAERHPGLVRSIHEAGHEVGSHTYWHEIVHRHDVDSLTADLRRSKQLVEDATGAPVRGFRAPGYSITPQTAWALDIVVDSGFEYDASVCPGVASHGGFPSAPTHPHVLRCNTGDLLELPSATIPGPKARIPYAGGGYFRLLPYSLIRAAARRENRMGWPTNVYLHPREIDVDQPRMTLPLLRRFKYYVGVSTAERKLARLLAEFEFTNAWTWLDSHRGLLASRILDVRDHVWRFPPRPDPARIPPAPDASVLDHIAS